MAPFIHPSSFVSPETQLDHDVFIGPFCSIGSGVRLRAGVRLHSHITIEGHTDIGDNTQVYPFATLGLAPQHLAYKGEPTRLIIGCNNQIREHVTIHRGTPMDQSLTSIGSHCLFMVGCHVAHDCTIGDHVVLANQTTLGGHVKLGDHVYIGGISAVLQFVRLGKGSMVAGFSGLTQDLPPYGLGSGPRCTMEGLNMKKLRHLGMDRQEIRALHAAYQWLFYDQDTPFASRIQSLAPDLLIYPCVQELKAFLLEQERRPICMPARSSFHATS